MSRYNTNLASEFHVLSTLHRFGLDAALTLGNKKAVDIFLHREDGATVTIDVKGVAKRYDWPVDNVKIEARENHFIILVCYNGKIGEPNVPPSVWVIPLSQLGSFVISYSTRSIVSQKLLRENGEKFKDAWHLLIEDRGKGQ